MTKIQEVRRFEKQGDLSSALSSCDAVLADEPHHLEGHQSRARILVKMRRYREASDALVTCRELGPGHPMNDIILGRLAENDGSLDDAVAAWSRILESTPDSSEARAATARILVKLSRLRDAQRVIAQADPEVAASVPIDVVRGRLFEKQGELLKSRDAWRRVLAAASGNEEAAAAIAIVDARIELGIEGKELDISDPDDVRIINAVRDAISRGSSETQESYLRRHSYVRYNRSISNFVPWIASAIELKVSNVVEIGCGTGSTTAALGMNCSHIFGYDIDPAVIATAEVRLDAMNVANVTLHQAAPDELQVDIMAQHAPASVDVVLMYALLEHLTIAERIEAIRNAWTMLRPGGVLVIIEAPNRLTYFDWHTSQLPFYHMLPADLQKHYYDRSPRTHYVRTITHRLSRDGTTSDALIRYGQSLSYHDLEVALGNLEGLIAADDLEPVVARSKAAAERRAEKHLQAYVREEGLSVHPAFTQANINVILRK